MFSTVTPLKGRVTTLSRTYKHTSFLTDTHTHTSVPDKIHPAPQPFVQQFIFNAAEIQFSSAPKQVIIPVILALFQNLETF